MFSSAHLIPCDPPLAPNWWYSPAAPRTASSTSMMIPKPVHPPRWSLSAPPWCCGVEHCPGGVSRRQVPDGQGEQVWMPSPEKHEGHLGKMPEVWGGSSYFPSYCIVTPYPSILHTSPPHLTCLHNFPPCTLHTCIESIPLPASSCQQQPSCGTIQCRPGMRRIREEGGGHFRRRGSQAADWWQLPSSTR